MGGAIIRLIGAVLLEANDEWQTQHRYMQTEPMAELMTPLVETLPTQITTVGIQSCMTRGHPNLHTIPTTLTDAIQSTSC